MKSSQPVSDTESVKNHNKELSKVIEQYKDVLYIGDDGTAYFGKIEEARDALLASGVLS